jgi:hypothetical protein
MRQVTLDVQRLPKSCLLAIVSGPLLAPSAACSFVMRGPPDRPIAADQEVRCESTLAPPVIDLAIAVPATALGLSFVIANAGKEGCTEGCPGPAFGVAIGAALIAGGILYGVSSAHGFSTARRCRDVIDNQSGCRGGEVAACLKLQADPAPPQVPAGNQIDDASR